MFAFDLKRATSGKAIQQDIHGDLLHLLLITAVKGNLAEIVFGPMCRFWSILLNRVTDGMPPPFRTRKDPWSHSLGSDTPKSQEHWLDLESLLILKPILLILIPQLVGVDVGYFMEHPEDPVHHPERAARWLTEEDRATPLVSVWLQF